jgi:hypothetical protein
MRIHTIASGPRGATTFAVAMSPDAIAGQNSAWKGCLRTRFVALKIHENHGVDALSTVA